MNIIITSFSGPSVMEILQAQGGQMLRNMFTPIKTEINNKLTELAKKNGIEPVTSRRRKTRREAMRDYLDDRYI